MNDVFHIREIIRDGINTVIDPKKKYFILIVLPLILSTLSVFFLGVFIKDNYVGLIIGSFAIFSGFFFTLIVYVSDKATNKRKEYAHSSEESDQRFLKKYLQFSERLIIQISYSIVVSIFAIILLFLTQFDFSLTFSIKDHLIEIGKFYFFSINVITLAVCFNFLLFLLLIISNMYALFLEETKSEH